MKTLPIILAIIVGLLALALVATKRSDNSQLETVSASIIDYSNRLELAEAQLAIRSGSILTLSNRLVETAADSLTISNELAESRAAAALQAEQATLLNQQITATTLENQALSRRLIEATNQLETFQQQYARATASLTQTNQDLVQMRKDYAQLQNRLQRDVAERVVVERRFNSLAEVQAQAEKLKKSPAPPVTAERIYAGLDIVIQANGIARIIAPE